MKIAAIYFLLVTAIFSAPFWHQPDGWALGVTFPDAPHISEKKTQHPKADILEQNAHVERDGYVFAAGRTTYSIVIPPERIEAAYDGGKKGMMQKRPGRLLSEEKILVGGVTGRRYLIEYSKGKRLMEHRTVIIGSEVFQFSFERSIKAAETSDAQAFFDSIGKTAEE